MSKWIEFVPDGTSPSGKTKCWVLYPAGDRQMPLGAINWYAPWRKYTFSPVPSTVFEQDCLRDIASFIEVETKTHHAARKTITA